MRRFSIRKSLRSLFSTRRILALSRASSRSLLYCSTNSTLISLISDAMFSS
nr:MAG TPA: hypothetical protein [Bacteriophage sp.]